MSQSEQAHQRLMQFATQYPLSEFGPAHVVVGDGNLRDGDLQWCLEITQAILTRRTDGLAQDQIDVLEVVDWYSDCSQEELLATVKVLTDLLAIPELSRL